MMDEISDLNYEFFSMNGYSKSDVYSKYFVMYLQI